MKSGNQGTGSSYKPDWHYKGFGPDCWGLTASYSVNGYAAHAPNERDDQGDER